MTQIVRLEQIRQLFAKADRRALLNAIEDAFIAYSERRAVVPPVGHLRFDSPPGDVHVKYGYLRNDDVYVVKLASSFYENPKLDLPSSNGLMLVFDQRTGELQAILLDEGYLTDVRTALAGAVVAKYLAPTEVNCIGVVGTGTQARMQVQYLKGIIDCQKTYAYSRSQENLDRYSEDMMAEGYEVDTTTNVADVTNNCNFIITTTPSTTPIITAEMVKPGTHITAMGADAKGKQELDPMILQKADLLIVDSLKQCSEYGELSHALEQQLIQPNKPIEIGKLRSLNLRRTANDQITVADLTGVAVQDIEIAKVTNRMLGS